MWTKIQEPCITNLVATSQINVIALKNFKARSMILLHKKRGESSQTTSLSSAKHFLFLGKPNTSSNNSSCREECHQLGRYWPLTTSLSVTRASYFKFVSQTVSFAPLGAWALLLSSPLLHPLAVIASFPGASHPGRFGWARVGSLMPMLREHVCKAWLVPWISLHWP